MTVFVVFNFGKAIAGWETEVFVDIDIIDVNIVVVVS